jgi:hypothetical protein
VESAVGALPAALLAGGDVDRRSGARSPLERPLALAIAALRSFRAAARRVLRCCLGVPLDAAGTVSGLFGE